MNDNDAEQTSEARSRALIAVTRRLIDPGRAAMTATSPYIVTGGKALDAMQLIRMGAEAAKHDADYIHLKVASAAEAAGPANVQVAMSRETNVVFFRMQCRFWLDPRGRPPPDLPTGRPLRHDDVRSGRDGLAAG